MKKTLCLLAAVLTVGWGNLAAEEAAAEADNKEVSNTELLLALEMIRAEIKDDDEAVNAGAPDFGFGGAPIFAFRGVAGMDPMSDYLKSQGSYGRLGTLMAPFSDGGAGTWRWVFSENFQIGANSWGFGKSSLGFLKHRTGAAGPNDTLDENADGYDDYYSYASYGFNAWSFLVQGRFEVVPDLVGLFAGGQAGLGSDSVAFTRSGRTRNVLTDTLGLQLGDTSWSRGVFVGGVFGGLDLRLDGDLNVFKLAIEGGYDVHLAMGDWMPATGMHRTETAPPADFSASNWWISVGPHFHF